MMIVISTKLYINFCINLQNKKVELVITKSIFMLKQKQFFCKFIVISHHYKKFVITQLY